jgi:bifunctional DNA-binding transcriptional regulator/antitoxin component of YhaV-PrlF toxin-antitoxin module
MLEVKEVTKTYLSGAHSYVLVIPKEIARRYGIDNPSHVIVEGTEEGILIKKLEI